MAWQDLSISPEAISGHASGLTYSVDLGGPDPNALSEATKDAAKRLFRTTVIRLIPSYIDDAGGISRFFDSAAQNAELADLIEDGLAYAYLAIYYRGEQLGDAWQAKAEAAERMMMESVGSFASLAPYALGLTSAPTSEASSSAGVVIVDAWD